MKLIIDIAGEVIEWQKLLNGTQIVTIGGASADGEWMLSGGFSWNIRSGSETGEGDLTLSRTDDSELFGTLIEGAITETAPADDAQADYAMRLMYEIDGGAGEFDNATGTAGAEGTLSRESFRARWSVELAS